MKIEGWSAMASLLRSDYGKPAWLDSALNASTDI
jgi:hypothetical protein